MDFYTIVDQAVELLRSRGRVSYRALVEQFGLDDERLDALRAEVLYAHADNVREDGPGLVWAADDQNPAEAERRQLTVLFCDLVDSTPLSGQLDPEELREVMRSYYRTCGTVIDRFDGYIAQYLGDGLLVFFGYPRAHEDDAQRAVRAGLGIIDAVSQLNSTLEAEYGVTLAVRLGCHTGLVVVGEVVGDARHEMMALGDTPNIAARLQSVASPNTFVIGALTHQLLGGLFNCLPLGTPPLKGVAAPLEVFQVIDEGVARTRLEVVGGAGLSPLVGRATELRMLEGCWSRAIAGTGQAVLVTGEAGIGKSRLAYALNEIAAQDGAWLTACHASPYHQDTAFYPFIDLLERVILQTESADSTMDKRRALEAFFARSGLPLDEELPHLCALLSIPPSSAEPIQDLPPEQQKKRALHAILTILRRRAAKQPVLLVVEDLHWVDPTTVELLTLLIEEIRSTRILALFTCRPDFRSPWDANPDVTELYLTRLAPNEASELTIRVAGNRALPDEIVAQVVSKTDGVPLFVEELTKMLIESGLLVERTDRYELTGVLPPMAIPNTLHDSLMARLDRLSAVKGLAQFGATIGRQFTYPLLLAAAPWSDELLRSGLAQLVAAEFLFQQGTPPEATYRFKHALIQDAAYQSLLKSTRQHYHRRIATTIETEFAELVATQPELLAHHYTEACLTENAVPYWEAAGRRALQRYANEEAANHANRGLELLKTLSPRPQHAKQELTLQILLGAAWTFVHGPHAVEDIYARARELAKEVGSTPELFPALSGFAYAQMVRGRMLRARALAEEFLALAQPVQDPVVMAVGHRMLAYTAWWQGDFEAVHDHSRRGLACYDANQSRANLIGYSQDSGVVCGYLRAMSDWVLGYPTQAAEGMESTVTHARALGAPPSIAMAILFSAKLAQLRRDPERAHAQAEEALAISTEHGLDAVALWCLLPRGWAFADRGDAARGITDIRDAMDRRRALGMGAVWPWFLALAAEAYGALGQLDDGLRSLDEAFEWIGRNDENLYAAEVHRMKGELLLRRDASDPAQAERCFEEALALARAQHAKSWELRAAMSLARTWQRAGRSEEARALLSPVYRWFTEGFDTADLKDAEGLLARLS